MLASAAHIDAFRDDTDVAAALDPVEARRRL